MSRSVSEFSAPGESYFGWLEEGTLALLSYGQELSESDPASMEVLQGQRSPQEG